MWVSSQHLASQWIDVIAPNQVNVASDVRSGFSLQRLKLWLFKLLMFNLLFPVSGEEEDDAFFCLFVKTVFL